MTKRPFRLKPGHRWTPCPQCGNQTEFMAYADRIAEDCCEVWVQCSRCGHDPTKEMPGERLEDVWGSLNLETISGAMQCRENALSTTSTRHQGAER